MHRSKIICTLGPSSSSPAVIQKLAKAGMNIARLNFSHGTHHEHLKRIELVRAQTGEDVKILQDLEGYRIRVGIFKKSDHVVLKKGQIWKITNDEKLFDNRTIPIDYEGSLADIKKNFLIFIDDGSLSLQVVSSSEKVLTAKVWTGGVLSQRKGINIPQLRIPFKGLTRKDKGDLEFGLSHHVDYIAQSFVRDREDILALKERLRGLKNAPKIIAKIENCEGIMNLDEIMKEVDGVMVARGDMGVSVPIYQIPIIQKVIIQKCGLAGKFSITATQMLDSMTENPRPTRAEVTDVANAILDGSDYVMLSGETAAGSYPVESVLMMSEIIDFTEKSIRKGRVHFDNASCTIPTTLT